MICHIYKETALQATIRTTVDDISVDKTEKGEWIGFEELWKSLRMESWFAFRPDKDEAGAFKTYELAYKNEFFKAMNSEIDSLPVNERKDCSFKLVFTADGIRLVETKSLVDANEKLISDGVYLLIARESYDKHAVVFLGNLGIYGEDETGTIDNKPLFPVFSGTTIDGKEFSINNVISYEVNSDYTAVRYTCSQARRKVKGYIRFSELTIIDPR